MIVYLGAKKHQYYRGLLIKADLALHEQIAAKVSEVLPPKSRILDLGAGEGALASRLADAGHELVAVDKDERGFKCKDVTFVRVDFDKPEELLAFERLHHEAFDAVLSVEVIEHVEDQWQYVRCLLNMAKPGGVIIITTPHTASWLSRLMFLFTGRFHQFGDGDVSYGHINPISPWEMRLILEKCGMKDIAIEPAGTLPPVYLTGFNLHSLLSVLILPLRPLMRGPLGGWCVMATARKSK